MVQGVPINNRSLLLLLLWLLNSLPLSVNLLREPLRDLTDINIHLSRTYSINRINTLSKLDRMEAIYLLQLSHSGTVQTS